jgi:outer membrane murein-binding lipoprotein Lpp
MASPTNTFTITVAGAHSHSAVLAGIAGSDKIDALVTALKTLRDQPSLFAAFTIADTWTITVTQP